MPLVWTLLLNLPLGLAAWLVARDGFRQPAGMPRGLAAVVLAWVWLTVGMEGLGAYGLLARGPLLGWVALGLAIGWGLRFRSATEPGARPSPSATPPEPWERGATLAVGLVLWPALILGIRSLAGPVQVVSDGPIYHLYFAARWWKAERLFLIATPFGENAATYFPAAGDLWFTWLIAGWGGERLAKIGQLPFLLVAALAAFGMARRLGAGVSASVVAVAWFVSVTPLFLFTFDPNVDTIFVAGYLVSAFFFLRYALGDDGFPALVLGGLAAGGALATKPTGVVFVPVLLAAAGISALVRERPIGRKAVAALILAVSPLVMAGFWYGRNALLTGNPLYPLQVELFGRVVLAGWYGTDVMRLSPFYIPVRDLRAFGDLFLAVFDPRLAPVWLAALVGAWFWKRPARGPGPWFAAFSVLAIANVALFWLVVPYRTQQRFMIQAVGLTAVPLARLFDRASWLRYLGVALLAAHLLTFQGWPFGPSGQEPPWDLTAHRPMDAVRVPNAAPPLILFPPLATWRVRSLSRVGLTFGLGLVGLAAAWTVGRGKGRFSIRVAAAGLGVAGLVTALIVAAGGEARRVFFADFPEFYKGWRQLEQRSGRDGSRIAYAGTNLPFYLLGTHLRNDVRYVNVDAHRGWLLHDYHRAARARGQGNWSYPRPGWDREHPDYDAWLANLRAEGIQMLVVTRADPNEGPHNIADADWFPIERQWAESHPETFEPLYGQFEGDHWIRLYRLLPPPN